MGRRTRVRLSCLTKALATSPVLVHPDFNKPFILFTNGNDVAFGVILAQHDENMVDHPITYYSKTLSKAKRNYSVTEQEFLAVLLVIKQFALSCTGLTSLLSLITPLSNGYNR